MADSDVRSHTSLDEALVRRFRDSLKGEVIEPDDNGYDEARKIWNGMIDKRPRIIARCSHTGDVVNAVNFARETGLLVAVRGGGHNVAGNAVCDGGIVIDLSLMKQIEVDAGSRRVRAGGGVTWGEYDRATAEHGLASTGGLISSTGIAGFTLGGGLGWLMRKYGAACDNMVSAEVVTAAGEVLTASADVNPDLFWGLRGGGGNFGVVTAFEFELHPVSQVYGGLLAYPVDRMVDLLRLTRDVAAGSPDELTMMAVGITAPPAPFVPQEFQGRPICAVAFCYAGDLGRAPEAVRPIREFAAPAIDLVGEMPYPALQSMLDATAPAGMQNYWKSGYLADLSDEAIAAVAEFASRPVSHMTQIHVSQLGGALARVPCDATAFSHRDAPYLLNIVSMWPNPEDREKNIDWTREFFKAMEPFQTGGAYVNFLGREGDERVRAAYGTQTYDRLSILKAKYDPSNFFHLNQNVKPA